jgi:hypothetical protein
VTYAELWRNAKQVIYVLLKKLKLGRVRVLAQLFVTIGREIASCCCLNQVSSSFTYAHTLNCGRCLFVRWCLAALEQAW